MFNHKEGLLVQGRPVQEMDTHDIVLLKNGGTVHEFVASLAPYLRSVSGTYKTGLQHKQLWRNLSFPPAAYVSKRPVQAGLRQMGQYQRHNGIPYADITLKTIPNSRYVEVHRPVALTVMAGVHKYLKNSRSRVQIVGARMMTWSKIQTEDPLVNTGRQRTKFSRLGDRGSCAPE
jgi:hypothetical protein